MKLKNKTTGEIYNIVSGFILDDDNVKKMNPNGSFLTIRKENSDKDFLYLWTYFADNDFDIIAEIPAEANIMFEDQLKQTTFENVLDETTSTDEDEVH